jgi:hypothetical protein
MRESLMYGSVRGTRGNSRSYRDEGARQSWRDQPVQVRPKVRPSAESLGPLTHSSELQ